MLLVVQVCSFLLDGRQRRGYYFFCVGTFRFRIGVFIRFSGYKLNQNKIGFGQLFLVFYFCEEEGEVEGKRFFGVSCLFFEEFVFLFFYLRSLLRCLLLRCLVLSVGFIQQRFFRASQRRMQRVRLCWARSERGMRFQVLSRG